MLFVGQHSVLVDLKGRLLFPMEVRRELSKDLNKCTMYLTLGANRVPWLFAEDTFLRLVAKLPSLLIPIPEVSDYDRSFAFTERIEIDSQGRAILPMENLVWFESNTEKEFYLIGCRDHIEMYSAKKWNEQRTKVAISHLPSAEAAREAYKKAALLDVSEKSAPAIPDLQTTAV